MGLNKTIKTQKMLGENVERYLKSDAHWVPVPPCPYCDEELDGPTANGLHDKCSEEFYSDMEKADIMEAEVHQSLLERQKQGQ